MDRWGATRPPVNPRPRGRPFALVLCGLLLAGILIWFAVARGLPIAPGRTTTAPAVSAPGSAPATRLPTAGPRRRAQAPATRQRSRARGAHPPGPARAEPPAQSSLRRVVDRIWAVVRVILLVLVALAALMAISRMLARGRRRYVRLWLLPFRADEAEPEEVRRLLESWHQQLLQRWFRRLALGQPGMALEVVMAPDTEGDRAARLSIVCPEAMSAGLEGALLASYSDSRLLRGGQALPPLKRVVRLKKRQPFVWALRTRTDGDDRNLMDALLTQMASIADTAVVQYALAPTPALFDRYSRWRFSSIERSAEGARSWDPASPGLRSEVMGAELQGGLSVQHRPLFFTDIRIGATTLTGCRLIAGALRGASGAENRLVERTHRPWARGGLYLRRLHGGLANPFPSWNRGVLSSLELAALWQLPTPGLKVVRVARSPLPRILAPPEISRTPEHALARDERGLVGIRPEDKSDGLGLIGGQKTGKTSVLCRTVRADALDPGCAVVVLMPKSGDALKALSTVPRNRTVHYMDLERPELGFNPLLGDGDPAMIADRVVEAFRDVHAEGDIRGSSDRYLRQAAQAAVGATRAGVLSGPATLWQMYRLLLPGEASFRERVVEALYLDTRLADTATFFGRELPGDLESAPSQTSAKLDAPRNKLLRLMVESLDKVLRHPVQLSFDELVRRREVLIVDGKMGTFGSDNCRVMMQFLLIGLYGALQRQQQLPEGERVRVAVKVDEAHLILNESFADAMATLRSGGLEMVAAWQYGDQIQDEKVRGGMMSLLRQRCMFSMGESQDAREMSQIAMASFTDIIRNDPESRARLRLTPDTIFNLPNHHAVCSWISRGARVPAFIAQTLPLESDPALIDHHLAAQRARGGHVPERLPDPLPDLDWDATQSTTGSELRATATAKAVRVVGPAAGAPAVVAAPAAVNGNGPAQNGAGPVTAEAEVGLNGGGPEETLAEPDGDGKPDLDFDPTASSVHDPDAREHRPAKEAPETYVELDLDDVRGIIWEKRTPLPPGRRPEPTARDLEILAALWTYRVLFANQIWRRWWRGSSARAAQQGLKRLTEAGWVRRFKFQRGERGAQQRVYSLTKEGFELARGKRGRRGAYIREQETWRELEITDPRRVLRDLHVNGWVLALEQLAAAEMGPWRGPRESRLEPPRRKHRGEWIDLRPSDIILGSNHRLHGSQCERLEPVSPDATVELRIPTGGQRSRLDVMVELDRARSSGASEERLRRYDVFVSGWSRLLPRYRTLGTPPIVVFVCEDERALLSLVRIGDRALTSRIAKAGTDELEWPFPGRRGILFALERDIHEGSLRAVALPERPAELRMRLEGPKAKACQPRRVHIVEPRLLRRGG
jgi:hypothetical protein